MHPQSLEIKFCKPQTSETKTTYYSCHFLDTQMLTLNISCECDTSLHNQSSGSLPIQQTLLSVLKYSIYQVDVLMHWMTIRWNRPICCVYLDKIRMLFLFCLYFRSHVTYCTSRFDFFLSPVQHMIHCHRFSGQSRTMKKMFLM